MKLDEVVDVRVKPLIEGAVHKYIGMHLSQLEQDVSDRLKKPLFDYPVDTSRTFRQARQLFRKAFLSALLERHLGNVSEVAACAGIKRETIHRLIKQLDIAVTDMRKHPAPIYQQEDMVRSAIQKTVQVYKPSLNQDKYDNFYTQIEHLSKEIAKELPEEWDLAQAETEWEKRFLRKAVKEHGGNVSKTARAIGLRYETLHRKLKALEVG